MLFIYCNKSNRSKVSKNKSRSILYSFILVLFLCIIASCTTNRNTTLSRTYHSVNTRYNVYFNAHEAYKEALDSKIEPLNDNLSEQLYIYPYDPDAGTRLVSERDSIVLTRKVDNTKKKRSRGILSSAVSSLLGKENTNESFTAEDNMSFGGRGSFTTTVDKCTKAIKTHSIKVKPRRDRAKARDPKYQAWIKQQEFNPFMKNVWLLLGKAEVQNGNYLQGISTFMYTSKVYNSSPEIITECQIWIARAYTEMGWMHEAGDVLYKLEHGSEIPEGLKGEYASVYANYQMRNGDYAAAIPYMADAIKNEKNKAQKLRLKYLLGQLYERTGDKAKAIEAYGAVRGLSTPYKYELNAQLNQLSLDDKRPFSEKIAKLTKLTKGKKNSDYQDKVYYTIGNAYMQRFDTINAVKNYRLAVDSGRSGSYDKALAQIRLGHIYFEQKEYVKAQPCYSEALSALKKTDKDYAVVSLRSEVLDELVIHVKTVHEQDSLQHLAQLPEEERIRIIQDKIAFLKEEELRKQKEEKRNQAMADREERLMAGWDDLGSEEMITGYIPNAPTAPKAPVLNTPQLTATFYFYNPQTVEQGKVAFQKQWGTRKLEDNWRRRNKSGGGFGGFDDELLTDFTADSLATESLTIADNQLSDSGTENGEKEIYTIDYYLKQLPFTAEAITKSNELIEDALFKMGGIYQYKLEDLYLAIGAYDLDLRRFPQTPNQQEIYYQLFLIYMQLNDRDKIAYYRNRLIERFPDSKYATALSEPDFEWNFRHMHALQDSIYEDTYEAYLDGDIKTVRANHQTIQRKYPFADLMPKFMLLNALTYAQERDAVNLKTNLESLVKDYPNSDVTPMAQGILDRIKDGQILMSDGTPIRGMKWDMSYEGEEGEKQILAFKDSIDDEHLMLLFFRSNTIDRNELLYQVADYNFSNYMIQTFDLSFDEDSPLEVLQIKGFEKFANIRSYVKRAFGADGLIHTIDPSILMVPISVENSKVLLRLGIEEYIDFYREHYGSQTPELLAYWQGDRVVFDESDFEEDVVETIDEDGIEIVDESEKSEPIQPEKPIKTEPKEVKESTSPKKIEETTTINASDIFNESQLDLIQDIGEVLENPVDGVKGLFQKYKDRKNMSKEEKEELKKQRQEEKMRQRALREIEKARQDSVAAVEKAIQDSIVAVEKAKIAEEKRIAEEKKRIEREKIEAKKAKQKERDDARRAKEQQRRDKKREQEDRRKNLEKEQNEKRKTQLKEREAKQKRIAEERRQRDLDAKKRRDGK